MSTGPDYYYEQSGAYERHLELPPFSTWVKANHRSLDEALPADCSGRVLEIGGGIGRLSRRLAARYPAAEVLSIDLSPQMIERANKSPKPPNLRFEERSFWDVSGDFDLIVSAGCWEFFQREPSVLRVVSLMAPGCELVINTLAPSPFSLPRQKLFKLLWRTDMWLHKPQDMVRELEAHGCRADWSGVNRTEGSYTLNARREG